MNLSRTATGFTIIELMVVVGIVAVLAVVALPSMSDLVTTNRMKSVSLDLYTSLSLARSEAIKRNTGNISILPASGGSWQSGWTVCVDANANSACDSGEAVLLSGDAISTGITLSGPAIVTYNRDGRLATAAASFKVTAGTNNPRTPMRCVDVSTSGRPMTRVDSNGTDSDGCN
jgi:type IV fimbrial biogenesis protein FimT